MNVTCSYVIGGQQNSKVFPRCGKTVTHVCHGCPLMGQSDIGLCELHANVRERRPGNSSFDRLDDVLEVVAAWLR